MAYSEHFSILTRPTRNLYVTAMAELDDDQLLTLVAGVSDVLAQYSKGMETAEERITRHKALVEEVQAAWTLYSSYEQRMRERRSSTAGPLVSAGGQAAEEGPWKPGARQIGKILVFPAQFNSSPVAFFIAGSR